VDLSGYRFEARSTHVFDVERAKLTELNPIVYEKGGPATPLVERPALRYVKRQDSALLGPGPRGTVVKLRDRRASVTDLDSASNTSWPL